jgi:hypothetical protein
MMDLQYMQELRQGLLRELQEALERVQQAKGAIALADQLIIQLQEQAKVDQRIIDS